MKELIINPLNPIIVTIGAIGLIVHIYLISRMIRKFKKTWKDELFENATTILSSILIFDYWIIFIHAVNKCSTCSTLLPWSLEWKVVAFLTLLAGRTRAGLSDTTNQAFRKELDSKKASRSQEVDKD